MADDPQVTFDEFDQAAKVDSLRRANQRLKSELKVTQDHVERLTGRLAVLEGIDRLDPKPPRWLTPKKPTMVSILSAILTMAPSSVSGSSPPAEVGR